MVFHLTEKIKIGYVELGENVYLEDGVTIISNVKIIHNCVIKIASVVNKSINEPNIYSSNKLIKKIVKMIFKNYVFYNYVYSL